MKYRIFNGIISRYFINKPALAAFKAIFFSLAVICLGMMMAPAAQADSTTTIRLRVETDTATIYDQNLDVAPCEDAPASGNYTVNGYCALEQAGLANAWSWWGTDAFLDSVNGVASNAGGNGVYWAWFDDLSYGETSLNKHPLHSGETLLLTYNNYPLQILVSTTTPLLNSTVNITIKQFGYDSSWNPGWSNAASSSVSVNGSLNAADNGIYVLSVDSAAPYAVFGKKAGYLDSPSLTINPILPSQPIHLRIETATTTIYNQDLTVTACDNGSGIFTVNGYCALEQAGLANAWSWWGTDAFLDSVNGVASNAGGNGVYWAWFDDLSYGETALNKHIMDSGENLLLTYGKYPLKLEVSTTTPLQNSSVAIYLKEFGYDSGWNPVWSLAASSSMIINGQVVFSGDGAYSMLASSTSPYSIYGIKTGYLDSAYANITAYAGSDSGVSGGGGSDPDARIHKIIDKAQAAQFMCSRQNTDGSFAGSNIYTDWSALALSAYDPGLPALAKLKDYYINNTDPLGGMNSVSDNARRAMALMALNIDPYHGTRTNYIGKIVSAYDGRQFGDPALFNDDIFALLVLLKAGYTINDPIIANVLDFILSHQSANGSWGSLDMTAAAVQSLSMAKSQEQVRTALSQAKTFLSSQQNNDGSFGNLYTTPWVMQAVTALGDDKASWITQGKNADDYLFTRQASDGGLGGINEDAGNRIWATAYALPAVLGRTWGSILKDFAWSPIILSPSDLIATSTDLIASTTLDIATSTPAEEIATSTPAAEDFPLAILASQDIGLNSITWSGGSNHSFPAHIMDATSSPLRTGVQIAGASDHLFASSGTLPIIDTSNSGTPSDLGNYSPAADQALSLADIDRSSSTLPIEKAARGLLWVSSGGTAVFGLYLGLKYLLSLV